MNGEKIRHALNDKAKPLSIGTITGLLVAGVAFVGLNFTLVDRYRGQGASGASLEKRVEHIEQWVADYENNVRPLRDRFIEFTGELPGLRREMERMTSQMMRLEGQLDDLEKRLGRMEGRTGFSGGGAAFQQRKIGDPR